MTTETEIKKDLIKGFKPDNVFKRIVKGYSFNHCAYIYPDGILLIEHKTVKSGKYETTIDVNHIWNCHIPIRETNGFKRVTRIVCHNSTVLLDGISSIGIYYNNNSTAMERLNVTCNTLTLITLSGAEHRMDLDFIIGNTTIKSGDYSIQYDDTSLFILADKLKSEGANVEIHS